MSPYLDHDDAFPALSGDALELSPQQSALAAAYDKIVGNFGKWGPNDSEVMYATADQATDDSQMPDPDDGRFCANCDGWQGFNPALNGQSGTCKWVTGPIDPMGLCKLNLVPGDARGAGEEDYDPEGDSGIVQALSLATGPTSSAVHINSIMGSSAPAAVAMPYGETTVTTLRKDAAMRYTLSPWYIPNQLDAHGEWTDQEELEAGLLQYSELNDRSIYLQHNTDVVAGRWVYLVQWPFAQRCEMVNPETGKSTFQVLPAGTAYIGIIWEPWAWQLVLDGKILGISIGGSTNCIEVEVDMEGASVFAAS